MKASRRSSKNPRFKHLLPVSDVTWVRQRLLQWFGTSGRRFPWRERGVDIYIQVVTEALLQRTRAETVAAFLPKFVSRFPTWSSLASASERQIGNCLRPIGLWRRRATSLSRLAKSLSKLDGNWPLERDDLEKMPGVGQYVASAVLMFVHGKAEPLLDANMARVIERLFGERSLADIRYDPWLQSLCRRMVRCRQPAAVNWAILDFAALICTSRSPKCDECPLVSRCRDFQSRSANGSGRRQTKRH